MYLQGVYCFVAAVDAVSTGGVAVATEHRQHVAKRKRISRTVCMVVVKKGVFEKHSCRKTVFTEEKLSQTPARR